MRYVFDFDGTITQDIEKELTQDVRINRDVVNKINQLHDAGHTIGVHTSRGMLSRNGDLAVIEHDFRGLIETILQKNGVKYDSLVLGKPSADVYVDDLSIHPDDLCRQRNILIGKFGRKVIFNPQSFSTKGGHFELLGFIDFLKQQHKLYVFGEFDELPRHKNIVRYDHAKHRNQIDLALVDNGAAEWQNLGGLEQSILDNTNKMVQTLNEVGCPILYSFVDPRLWIDKTKFKNKVYVLNQNEDGNDFRGHQEKLCLLTLPFVEQQRDPNSLIVVGRDNGRSQIYDRYLTQLRQIFPTINVYGNFKFEHNQDLVRGELKADEVGQEYAKHGYTLMFPVQEGWLTQKIIEARHYGVIPLMIGNYDSNGLETSQFSHLKIDNGGQIDLNAYHKDSNITRLHPKFYQKDWWQSYYNNIFNEVCAK